MQLSSHPQPFVNDKFPRQILAFPFRFPNGVVVSLGAQSFPRKRESSSANLWKCAVVGLDSLFRGNDWRLEKIPIPSKPASASEKRKQEMC